ncbi:MAG: Asp-tRNA(Asn)/Glu-tRNA(Gln) amidotransferase GatCAB subunit A, partial [Chloroflexota bacterium]|nr:Asp-tRNA(Asn)/Glu-tRNA(Gln) amidotransferase GatCAB subunit A [Chloroflexota bacterium]
MADALPLADRTVTEVGELLRRREVSSRDLTRACLSRITRDGEEMNTFLSIGEVRALEAADLADSA